ncbi:MAG: tRNA (adenosine(37)-N6)-dimethylallyltransferase MiaA [Nitrospinales bacterium]
MFPIIIIAGPTAAGKSDVAIELAMLLDTEVINADSMQVYKYLNIGTAKPSPKMRSRVGHHLIDILEPDEKFTAFDYKTRAEEVIAMLHKKGKVPIISGGSGLYIKTITENFNCAVQVSQDILDRVKMEITENGLHKIYRELCAIDPVTANNIQANDKQRIERAISVYRETGKSLSTLNEEDTPQAPRFENHYFVLQWERQKLYERINDRVDRMINDGLVEETQNILQLGFSKNLKPLQGIGYNQSIQYIDGKISLDQAVNEIKRDSRNYAKRQITWFKKASGATPISMDEQNSPKSVAERILSRLPSLLMSFLVLIIFTMTETSVKAEQPQIFDEGIRAYQNANYKKAVGHFLSVRKSNPDSLAGKRALYYLGKTYVKIDRLEQAIRLFISALAEYPQIEDYIRFNLAQVYFQSDKYQLALKQINTMLKEFPQSILLLEAEMFRADLLKHLGQNKKAIIHLEEIEDFIKNKPGGKIFKSWVPEIIFKRGETYEALNKPDKAFGLYWDLFIYHSNHPATAKALFKIKRLVRTNDLKPPVLSLEKQSTRISNLLKGVRYQEAINEIDEIKRQQKDIQLPIRFYFFKARAYNGLRQRQKANDTLDTFIKAFPTHPRVPEAQYTMGRNAWNLGNSQLGIDFFQSNVVNHKNSKWVPQSRFLLGKVYEDIKNHNKAIEYYKTLISSDGQNIYAQKAVWNIGWNFYKRNKFQKALQHFEESSQRFPQGRYIEKILFWMAKANEKTGNDEKAMEIYKEISSRYPFTYYGIQANEKLVRKGLKSSTNNLFEKDLAEKKRHHKQLIPETLSEGLSKAELFHFNRANEMTIMGFNNNATLEINWIERSIKQTQSNTMWVSMMYNRAQDYAKAVRTLSRQFNKKSKEEEKELSFDFWDNYYPSAYSNRINIWSKEYQVDPILVKSIIRQESLYDAKALSPAGAMGLMQVMPKTGQKLWQQLNKKPKYDSKLLFDPEINIQLGVKYIDQLRNKYGEYDPYILICYNAGPHVLEKWLRRFNDVKDNDVFIESIPYPETRKYIKRVMRNYGIYKLLNPI